MTVGRSGMLAFLGLSPLNRAAAVTAVTAAAAWLALILVFVTGFQHLMSHDAAFTHSGLPLPIAALVFLVGWQLMIGAMMLPATLPMVSAFSRFSRTRPRPQFAVAVFLGVYFVVWTGFGVAAVAGDMAVHEGVHHSTWFGTRPWTVSATVFLLAGAYQFLPVKRRCLADCRDPDRLLAAWSGGTGAPWRLGVRHGAACLGSSWALMLVMFAVGLHALWWILGLTFVLGAEKVLHNGERFVRLVGVALLAASAFVALSGGLLTSAQ